MFIKSFLRNSTCLKSCKESTISVFFHYFQSLQNVGEVSVDTFSDYDGFSLKRKTEDVNVDLSFAMFLSCGEHMTEPVLGCVTV